MGFDVHDRVCVNAYMSMCYFI